MYDRRERMIFCGCRCARLVGSEMENWGKRARRGGAPGGKTKRGFLGSGVLERGSPFLVGGSLSGSETGVGLVENIQRQEWGLGKVMARSV